MKRVYSAVTRIVVLSCLFIGMGGIGGAVLCFGADGHVGLEGTLSGCCTNFSPFPLRTSSQSSMKNAAASTADHFACCVDIPISKSGTDQQYLPPKKNSLQKQPLLLEGIDQAASRSNAIATAGPLLQTPPGVNPTLSSLLTIVLLI